MFSSASLSRRGSYFSAFPTKILCISNIFRLILSALVFVMTCNEEHKLQTQYERHSIISQRCTLYNFFHSVVTTCLTPVLVIWQRHYRHILLGLTMKYVQHILEKRNNMRALQMSAVVKGTVTIWEMSDNMAVTCSSIEMNYRPLEVGT